MNQDTIFQSPVCFQKSNPNRPSYHREVWWCWIVNEPGLTVLGESKEHMACGKCGWEFESDEMMHTFVAHIHKPREEGQYV